MKYLVTFKYTSFYEDEKENKIAEDTLEYEKIIKQFSANNFKIILASFSDPIDHATLCRTFFRSSPSLGV